MVISNNHTIRLSGFMIIVPPMHVTFNIPMSEKRRDTWSIVRTISRTIVVEVLSFDRGVEDVGLCLYCECCSYSGG